ncbi:MAG: hypothetical protein GWN01_08945 [Nitrosopumilaceae archaeon]|nr:hypothetical protein [Nitrosopumilaceae archaeon]NIU01035.1 hypothetical protein [Nitrosopumilaceae archaeon]NIU87469.1 hypothetical protein [Nitrosopumilaceae archaeon]NIV65517.1 hypothetical protein [Nitrosopumilaceae archaeon]NIX61637.1 hypothetical protein [Nitrosopumilaceae archaeon]
MDKTLLILPLFIIGIGMAYAEPLENIETSILEYENGYAVIQLNWNDDESAKKYEAGCVSCIPNISEFTSTNTITMKDIAALPSSSNAMLYVLAYGSNDEILTAKQILVDIKK